MIRLILISFASALLSIPSHDADVPSSLPDQQLELAVPFTDNMILQRESEVPIWGFDTPGSQVTIEFAGQTKTAVADKNGDWMVKLDPLKVSR